MTTAYGSAAYAIDTIKIGDMVGLNWGIINGTTAISGLYSAPQITVNATGNQDVGGIVGANYGTVMTVFATPTLSFAGSSIVGGLVAYGALRWRLWRPAC